MEVEEINAQIGRKIRDLRNRNGLTQQELADRAELTKGFISQLERGQVSPSVITLLDLIEILGSKPEDFFREDDHEQVVFSQNDYFEKTDASGSSRKWLVPSAQKFQMEPLLVVIAPGQSLEEDKPHVGEEFGYVLSGKLNLYLGERIYHAKAGESFYYQAKEVHRIANPASRPAKLLWITTPPMF